MNYLNNVDHVYGPYTTKKTGRQTVTLRYKSGEKRTVSYPRFLVEIVLGRQLE